MRLPADNGRRLLVEPIVYLWLYHTFLLLDKEKIRIKKENSLDAKIKVWGKFSLVKEHQQRFQITKYAAKHGKIGC